MKKVKNRILSKRSAIISEDLQEYCAEWVRDNIQGRRIWPRNKWIALGESSKRACRLNIFTADLPEGECTYHIQAYPPFDGCYSIPSEEQGVEINCAQQIPSPQRSAHEIIYHVDTGNLKSELIPIYSAKDDVYRAPAAQDKFIAWLKRNCAPNKNGSILASALYEILVGSPEKIKAFAASAGLSPADAPALTTAVNFLVDTALPQIHRELIASLLAQPPNDNNTLATYYALREACDSFIHVLSSPQITCYLGERKNFPGIDHRRIYSAYRELLQRGRVPAHKHVLTAEQETDYLREQMSAPLRQTEGANMNISEADVPEAEGSKKPEAFAQLCNQLKILYQTGGWSTQFGHLLMSPDIILARLSEQELVGFPRVVPGKCKLAPRAVLREIASANLLPTALLNDNCADNAGVFRVSSTENNYYHGSEKLIVRDKSAIKIIQEPEIKIGIGRE